DGRRQHARRGASVLAAVEEVRDGADPVHEQRETPRELGAVDPLGGPTQEVAVGGGGERDLGRAHGPDGDLLAPREVLPAALVPHGGSSCGAGARARARRRYAALAPRARAVSAS